MDVTKDLGEQIADLHRRAATRKADEEANELRRLSLLEAMKASRLPNLAQIRDTLIFLLGDGK
jgi:hypothetical protein